MRMSPEEIEELREKIEKEPDSRLFLPLAEEYRKAGMLDDAITALLNGLERQPRYTSARVALGRIYLEKDMLNEARAEFESVVKVAPDNLFAHRKLAEIYNETGETKRALAEYKEVLKLHPLDEEVKACVEALEGKLVYAVEAEEPAAAIAKPPQEFHADEIQEFPEGAGYLQSAGPDIADFNVKEGFERLEGVLTEKQVETGLKVEDSGRPADIKTGEGPGGSGTAEVRRIVLDDVDVTAADALVASGDYYKAVELYKELLVRDPDNKHLLQRLAELKAFLKMTGKGEDVLVARLEAFLESIKNRKARKAGQL